MTLNDLINRLLEFDVNIFYHINQTYHSQLLDRFFSFVTTLGGSGFIFILALLMILLRRRNFRITGLLLLAGLTVSYQVVYLLKHSITRVRPFLALEGVNVLMTDNGFSFPSGHATLAFMAAFVMSKYLRAWYVFYPVAILVAVSRVYLGVHYPSDVLAGACIGLFIGHIMSYIYEKVKS